MPLHHGGIVLLLQVHLWVRTAVGPLAASGRRWITLAAAAAWGAVGLCIYSFLPIPHNYHLYSKKSIISLPTQLAAAV